MNFGDEKDEKPCLPAGKAGGGDYDILSAEQNF